MSSVRIWRQANFNLTSLWFSLQDEVEHTLTENRVLQTANHPFLTVSLPSLYYNSAICITCCVMIYYDTHYCYDTHYHFNAHVMRRQYSVTQVDKDAPCANFPVGAIHARADGNATFPTVFRSPNKIKGVSLQTGMLHCFYFHCILWAKSFLRHFCRSGFV